MLYPGEFLTRGALIMLLKRQSSNFVYIRFIHIYSINNKKEEKLNEN